jgi:molybdate transport system substrate-binding protein
VSRGSVVLALGAAVILVATSACAAPEHGTTVTVFAAASLSDVLEGITADYEAEHPAVDIKTSYGGSADLAAQIAEGAPADVFISADESRMADVASLTAGTPAVIASNTLTIAVPVGNPAGITGLGDLSRDDVVTVICAPHVPCGAASRALARALGVSLRPASEEQSVSDVLGKVASGQADAGLVYVTDVARAAGVAEVRIPGADAVVNQYVAAALSSSTEPTLAADFVTYLTEHEAQAAFREAGFGSP